MNHDAARRLEAVVLDFDGVILDSETPEYEAHRRIFASYGATLTEADWTGQIGVFVEGQAERWHRRLMAHAPDAFDLAHFEEEKRRLFAELVSADPMPGIRALLDALDGAGVPVGIASTSPARWVVSAATKLGLAGRVRAIVTADDVVRRKPEPDVYLEAARRLRASPARSVAIEDSGPGVASARAAGLKTIAIPHRLTEGHDLRPAHRRMASAADVTLDLLQALVAQDE